MIRHNDVITCSQSYIAGKVFVVIVVVIETNIFIFFLLYLSDFYLFLYIQMHWCTYFGCTNQAALDVQNYTEIFFEVVGIQWV